MMGWGGGRGGGGVVQPILDTDTGLTYGDESCETPLIALRDPESIHFMNIYQEN